MVFLLAYYINTVYKTQHTQMNNDIVYNESHAPETVAEQQQLDLHHPPAAESHIIPSSVDKQSRFHRFVVQ